MDLIFFLEIAKQRVIFIEKKAQEAQVLTKAIENETQRRIKENEKRRKEKAEGNYTRRELGPPSGGRAWLCSTLWTGFEMDGFMYYFEREAVI